MTQFLTKKNKEYVLELIKQTIGSHYKLNLDELRDYNGIYNREARNIQEKHKEKSMMEKNKILIKGFINIYKDIYRTKLQKDADEIASVPEIEKNPFVLPTYETQFPLNTNPIQESQSYSQSSTISEKSKVNDVTEHMIPVNNTMTFDNSLGNMAIEKLIFLIKEDEESNENKERNEENDGHKHLLTEYYVKVRVNNHIQIFFQKFISKHHIVYEPHKSMLLEATNREQKIEIYLDNNQVFEPKQKCMLYCRS